MAAEITYSDSLSFTKGSASAALTKNGTISVSGANYIQKPQSIPTTAGGTALDVAGLSTLGRFFFKNNDSTNTITILTAVSGTNILSLPPGETATGRFASGITAPAAISSSSAAQLEYLIVEN